MSLKLQAVSNLQNRSGFSQTYGRGDFLSILPWLVLPYDSLTHLVSADLSATSQTLPLTALLSLPYVILRGKQLRSNRISYSVFNLMLLAFFIMLIVTAVNVLAENVIDINADTDVRAMTGARQAISMLLGICSFLMLTDAIMRIGSHGAAQYLVWGFTPTLLLCGFQFFTGAYRVQGFSSEPSHLADMLVFVFFPAVALIQVSRFKRIILVAIGLGLLLLTFSTTGYLKALLAAFLYYLLRGQIASGLLKSLIFLSLGMIVLNLFPDNYVFKILIFMIDMYEQTGQFGTASFIDRFFGFIGPITQLSGVHGWLGYGFGGDSVYFDSLFSDSTASAIREAKGDVASISSLQGKMIMYGGVLGYAIYLLAWKRSISRVPRTHIARVMIPVVFTGSVFSLGPIFLPYVWLWLALGAYASHGDHGAHLIHHMKAS
jgi:hypothetical protein